MEKSNFITKKEKEMFEKELEKIKTTDRPRAIERLQVARSYGDLSENSEYESARKEQAQLENRINEIENQLKTADIIEEDTRVNMVSIGNTVTVETEGEQKTFCVGCDGEITISPHSPIAEGLIGKQKGEVATIRLPKGEVEMKIIKIM